MTCRPDITFLLLGMSVIASPEFGGAFLTQKNFTLFGLTTPNNYLQPPATESL